MYTAEAWWKDSSASFYTEGEDMAIEEMLLPSFLEMRLGAGERKTRNPKTRGSVARTLVESFVICLGISMEYQQA